MKNVTITWDLPTTRESGHPLNASEIQHVRVEISADGGAVFTAVGTVLPTDVQSFFIADVDIGDWIVRLIVVDTSNRESTPSDTMFNVPDETPPKQVSNVNVALS